MTCHIGGYDEGLTLSKVIAINHRSFIEKELLEILMHQGQIEGAIQKLLAEMKFEAKIANQDTGNIYLSGRLPGDEWRNQDDKAVRRRKGPTPNAHCGLYGQICPPGLDKPPWFAIMEV
jgi:hypothetical protein